MDLAARLRHAAALVRQADALLVFTGAGMGVDSGFGTFRGRNAGVWPPLLELGLEFPDMSNPQWFVKDAPFAWAFWNFRITTYGTAEPHRGYQLLLDWGMRCPHGLFSFTSNVDGHWGRAGLPEDRLYEVHGAVSHLQCSAPCGDEVWPTPPLRLEVDEAGHRVRSPLPRCPACGAVARPNVLMFGDWGYVSTRQDPQEAQYRKWLRGAADRRLVIVEIGAGKAVATVRHAAEANARQFGVPLIRINLDDDDLPPALEAAGSVGIPMGALAALEEMDLLMAP
eukprot:EG_transcript_18161